MTVFIIITFNNQNQIQTCLDSIFSLIKKKPIKIIIIDNHSSDQTLSIIEKNPHPEILLIKNQQNFGFAKAVNQGIKIAQRKFNPDYFFLLNPDAFLVKDTLEIMLEKAKNKPEVGIVAPKIIDPKTRKILFLGGKINWLKMKTFHFKKNPSIYFSFQNFLSTLYLSGCALLIKKKLIEKTGLLNERFFLYYEDADFSLRAQRKGFQLSVASEAVCYHQESSSSNNNDVKIYYLVKSGLIFFHQHYLSWLKPYFWLVFYFRYFYHYYFSGKKIVIKAMEDFKNAL
mgnify:CR=1 FL=1